MNIFEEKEKKNEHKNTKPMKRKSTKFIDGSICIVPFSPKLLSYQNW